MKETIFHLENRGSMYIYHFIYYNLAGLYYIEHKLYNIKGHDATKQGSTFPILSKVVSNPSHEVTYPIKIHMNDIKPFHREAFEMIQDKFILVEDLNTLEDYEVVNIYGGYVNKDLNIIVPYIRNLFISKVKGCPEKNIYITRKFTSKFHNNILKRYMINEEAFLQEFQDKFEYIVLEDLSFKEKIELFMNAKNIISTHSGGLSFITFCNKYTNIIEVLNNGTSGFPHNHYSDISAVLKLSNYRRYTNINEDKNGNFYLNINDFKKYLLKYNVI